MVSFSIICSWADNIKEDRCINPSTHKIRENFFIDNFLKQSIPYKVNLNIKNSMHPFTTIYFQYPPQFWIADRMLLRHSSTVLPVTTTATLALNSGREFPIIFQKTHILILHQLKSEVYISEMAGKIAVCLDPTTCKMSTPHDIIPGIEGQIQLHSITFGCDTDKGCTFPIRFCSTIVFSYHKGTVGHLGIPFWYKHSIKRLWLTHLRTLYYNHEVCNHRIVQTKFRLC